MMIQVMLCNLHLEEVLLDQAIASASDGYHHLLEGPCSDCLLQSHWS